MHSEFFKQSLERLKGEEGKKQLQSVKELAEFAEKGASPLCPLVLRLRASIALCLCFRIL